MTQHAGMLYPAQRRGGEDDSDVPRLEQLSPGLQIGRACGGKRRRDRALDDAGPVRACGLRRPQVIYASMRSPRPDGCRRWDTSEPDASFAAISPRAPKMKDAAACVSRELDDVSRTGKSASRRAPPARLADSHYSERLRATPRSSKSVTSDRRGSRDAEWTVRSKGLTSAVSRARARSPMISSAFHVDIGNTARAWGVEDRLLPRGAALGIGRQCTRRRSRPPIHEWGVSSSCCEPSWSGHHRTVAVRCVSGEQPTSLPYRAAISKRLLGSACRRGVRARSPARARGRDNSATPFPTPCGGGDETERPAREADDSAAFSSGKGYAAVKRSISSFD